MKQATYSITSSYMYTTIPSSHQHLHLLLQSTYYIYIDLLPITL